MAKATRKTAKAAKLKDGKTTVLRPSTDPQREYIQRWAVSSDVSYGATCTRRQADELERRCRGDGDAVAAVANMRALARRLDLLARSLKRVVVRG